MLPDYLIVPDPIFYSRRLRPFFSGSSERGSATEAGLFSVGTAGDVSIAGNRQISEFIRFFCPLPSMWVGIGSVCSVMAGRQRNNDGASVSEEISGYEAVLSNAAEASVNRVSIRR